MRLGNHSWLLGILILFFAGAANAATYYWQVNQSGTYYRGSSPHQVCTDAGTNYYGDNFTYGATKVSDTYYKCTQDGTVFNNAFRYGDSCPTGATYNNVTGACDCPSGNSVNPETNACEPDNPCADKAGEEFPFSKNGNGPDDYMGFSSDGKTSFPMQSGCFNNCVADTTDQKCNARVSGLYLCKGTAIYTGAQCGSETPPLPVSPTEDPELPPPSSFSDTDNCEYVTQPDGSLSCSSSNSNENEGHTDTTNPNNNTPPEKEQTDIDTTVKTNANGDGTTTTTKTDTATYTKCTGVNSCTSTTTTNVTNTTKDGSGNTTSVSGTCTGAQCPDKNGNPDGDGDGFGDCVGENCAIDGAGGDWYEPTEETFGTVLGGFVNRVKASPIGQAGDNFFTFNATGSCPVWDVSAWVFTIRIDQHCTTDIPWELIRAVVLACAAFVAFRWALM